MLSFAITVMLFYTESKWTCFHWCLCIKEPYILSIVFGIYTSCQKQRLLFRCRYIMSSIVVFVIVCVLCHAIFKCDYSCKGFLFLFSHHCSIERSDMFYAATFFMFLPQARNQFYMFYIVYLIGCLLLHLNIVLFIVSAFYSLP